MSTSTKLINPEVGNHIFNLNHAQVTFQDNNITHNEVLLKNLLTDKIFQFYFYKYFHNQDYEKFNHFKDSEKINFLVSLFLYVSKPEPKSNLEMLKINNATTKLNFFNNINLIPNDIGNKFNSVTSGIKKQEILEKMNNFNLLETHNEKFKFKSDHNEVEVINKLTSIQNKYSNLPEVKYTLNNTNDVDDIISKLENLINKNNKTSNFNDNVLEQYIKDENDILHSNTINKNLIYGEAEEDAGADNNIYNVYNNTQNNNYIETDNNFIKTQGSVIMPIYTPNFFKVDFYNKKKISMGQINKINSEFYIVNIREIYIVSNSELFNEVIISKNNGIKNNNNEEPTQNSSNYKKLSHKNKKSAVNPFNYILFNKNPNRIFSHSMTKTTLLRKENTVKTPYHQNTLNKTLIKDLILVNEPITHLFEMNIDKKKKKCFTGRDIIDRIYFCPFNGIVVLDHNETNKVGIMLLDYIRLEENQDMIRNEYEIIVNELSYKIEYECKQFNDEKDKLMKEINNLKLAGEKRLEIFYNYISALRSKIEFSHKLFNEEEDANELDNSKIIEIINKNLDNLAKNNEDFLDADINNLTVDVSMDSSNNTTTYTKSAEFYIKKRIGNNMSTNIPSPINSNI